MTKNMELYERAKNVMPGGGTSGGRAHQILKYPLYMDHTEGCRMYTVDGDEYMDFCCGSGATLYGHNHPRLKKAVQEAVEKGFFMGYESETSVEFAERLQKLVPSLEKIRLCNSGTEATMGAIRVARGYTGKNIIIKMDGHFHGMHEMVWYGHGNFPPMDEHGEVECAVPDSAGFPADADKNVRVIRFNDAEALAHALEKYRGQVAAVIMEPISYNCGCYEARKEYLHKARELCTREQVLLIFDEVICGFRIRPGSAQEYYGVEPDITTLGKIVGGGMPVGAYGGRKEIMEMVAPVGGVYQAGTLSGNPIAMTAGLTTLRYLDSHREIYDKIDKNAQCLEKAYREKLGNKVWINRVGSLMSVFFTPEEVKDMDSALESDTKAYADYFSYMIDNGIYIAPSQFEAMFISDAHGDYEISKTCEVIRKLP